MGKIEKTHSELNQLHSSTLDLLSIGCWRWDWHNNLLYVDEVWSRLLAPQNGSTLDMDWWLAQTHPSDLPAFKASLDAITERKTDHFSGEFRFKTARGEWKQMHVCGRWDSKQPTNTTSQMVGVLAPGFDYSSETAIRGYNSFYEQTFQESFEHATIGMAILDLEGRWRKVNPQLEEILGYSEDELKELSFREITHPDDLKPNLAVFEDLLKEKQSHYYTEKQYLHKNGSYIHALLTVSLIRDERDEPHHFLARIIDITHLVRATRELEVLLKISNDQVERLQNFAYIVSHNLKSHAANIQGLSLILESADLNDHDRTHFGFLRTSTEKLTKTIDQLQEIVHIKSTVADSLTDIVLSKAIQSAILSTEAEAKSAGATLTVEVPRHLKVMALQAYLDSILYNLIHNAIKYRSSERPCQITITAEKKDDWVRLSIQDNGRGIDLEKNGEILYDLYETFHENADSQGIGLFITKNQLDAMGGHINAESQVGKGTTFTVSLRAAV